MTVTNYRFCNDCIKFEDCADKFRGTNPNFCSGYEDKPIPVADVGTCRQDLDNGECSKECKQTGDCDFAPPVKVEPAGEKVCDLDPMTSKCHHHERATWSDCCDCEHVYSNKYRGITTSSREGNENDNCCGNCNYFEPDSEKKCTRYGNEHHDNVKENWCCVWHWRKESTKVKEPSKGEEEVEANKELRVLLCPYCYYRTVCRYSMGQCPHGIPQRIQNLITTSNDRAVKDFGEKLSKIVEENVMIKTDEGIRVIEAGFVLNEIRKLSEGKSR